MTHVAVCSILDRPVLVLLPMRQLSLRLFCKRFLFGCWIYLLCTMFNVPMRKRSGTWLRRALSAIVLGRKGHFGGATLGLERSRSH